MESNEDTTNDRQCLVVVTQCQDFLCEIDILMKLETEKSCVWYLSFFCVVMYTTLIKVGFVE